MYITYRDEVGQIVAHVNEYGISFCDGYAYFDTEDMTVKISTTSIISICEA